MRNFYNLKIRDKLIINFLIISAVVLVVAGVGYFNMKSINDGTVALYRDALLPNRQLDTVNLSLYKIRGDVYKFILLADEQAAIEQSIHENVAAVDQQLTLFRAGELTSQQQQELLVVDRAWQTYQAGVQSLLAMVKAGDRSAALEAIQEGGQLASDRQAIGAALDKLVATNIATAEAINTQGDQTFSTAMRLILVVGALGVLLAIGLGIFLARIITKPLQQVIRVAQQIADVDLASLAREMDAFAEGDLTRRVSIAATPIDLHTKDEVGQLAAAFNGMILRLQETGHAFAQMTANLQRLVNSVAENAGGLRSASGLLAVAAEQSGLASGQIASTIQQIAHGTAQQADSITYTATSLEQMSRAIDGVARGAQEQATSVEKTSNVTNQIAMAIQKVASNARAQADGSAESLVITNTSVKTVEETIGDMHAIKEKVSVSAQKVQEMGQRSDQIGLIIETIDDIASQTNMLALNAAIEAARAGEHGKGFAVVADEVRKLAEKSGSATKQISNLIKDIQQTVADAVQAMDESAGEVENGVLLASQSGKALEDILHAIQTGKQYSDEIAAAADEMSALSEELVRAMDSVSAVVEENTAATEEMAAGSGEITHTVENIASVSEENSAAVEEVSAAAEEVSAQVEEVVASVQSLTNMAADLQAVVNQFKLTENENLSEKVEMFKQAHLRWVDRLKDMLDGKNALQEDQVGSHTDCILGKWYYGRGELDFGELPAFKALEEPHAHLHAEVRNVVALFNHGDRQAAVAGVKMVERLSQNIVSALDQLESRSRAQVAPASQPAPNGRSRASVHPHLAAEKVALGGRV